MDSPRIAIKWFAQPAEGFEPQTLVPLFHKWIQEKLVPDHVLIDVADYAHVIDGPGIVLVSYEATFSYDLADNRPGLLYARQRRLDGTFADRLKQVAIASLAAASRLEQQTDGKLKFQTDQLLFRINDRLAAPSEQQTFAQLEPDLHSFFGKLLGDAKLTFLPSDHRPFEVNVTCATPAASVSDLHARLS